MLETSSDPTDHEASKSIPGSETTFAAFISYASEDRQVAIRLQRDLERLRIPRQLVGTEGRFGPIPASLGRIFLDRTDLSAAPQITEEIANSLRRSAALIVLCSRSAADPKRWIDREIAAYRKLRPQGRIFAVIVRDEPPGCFPSELRQARGNIPEAQDLDEPLAADMRAEGDGPRDALVKLAAGLLGIDFDLLRRRRAETQRRQRRVLWAVAAAYAITITVALFGVARSSLQLNDSRRIAIASQAKTASDNGRYDTALLLSAVALPPAGSRIQAPAADAEAQAIRALTHNLLERVVPVGNVKFMAVDANRNRVFLASVDQPIVAHELPTGRIVESWHAPRYGVRALALSADTTRLAMATSDGSVIVVNSENGTEVARSGAVRSGASALAFSTLGDQLAMGSDDGYVRIFDIDSKNWIGKSPRLKGSVTGVAFSLNGKSILSGSYGDSTGQSLIEWNVERGNLVRSYDAYATTISRIKGLAMNGLWATTFTLGKRIFLHFNALNVPDREIPIAAAVVDVEASADLHYFLTASWESKSVDLLNPKNGRVLAKLSHPDWVHSAAFFDQERRIITASRDGNLRIWRNPALDQPKIIHRFEKEGPTELAWLPDNRTLVAAGWKNAVALVDRSAAQGTNLPTEDCADLTANGNCYSRSIAISAAGDKALIGTATGRLFMLDLGTRTELWSRKVADQPVLKVAFHPDGQRVAARLGGGSIELSMADTGHIAQSYVIEKPTWAVSGADRSGFAFDPSGAYVAETTSRGINIRRLSDRTVVWHSDQLQGAPAFLAWSPNGRKIAVGTSRDTVELFDALGSAIPRVLRAHTSAVMSLSFSPNSRFLVSNSDKEQIVWDVPAGREIMQIDQEDKLPSAGSFSPDGRYLAVSDTSGNIRVLAFNAPSGDLRTEVCNALADGRRNFTTREMIELSFLDPHEREPCSMPGFLTLQWAKQTFADWTDAARNALSGLIALIDTRLRTPS
jgi:WD40 repeat protein